METKRIGKRTVKLQNPPSLNGFANVVGKHEGDGPLSKSFDFISEDTSFGESSWEKAENAMVKQALGLALDKAALTPSQLNFIFAGDLLNQCVGTAYGLRDSGVPLAGLYGACSTMAEGLGLAAMLIDGGFADNAAALASSHFCTAERQYRFPLEYGSQRPFSTQWTVTGCGAVILGGVGDGPFITHVTMGHMIDAGIKDANNMGAAMAPAAYDTINTFFTDTGTLPSDYDMIVTGDLGSLGHSVVVDFFADDGIDIAPYLRDCGMLIYDPNRQDVHAGGSGCGCSAAVLTGYLLNGMLAGNWNRILFAGTGSLHSPTMVMQGESIPGICHAVLIENTAF